MTGEPGRLGAIPPGIAIEPESAPGGDEAGTDQARKRAEESLRLLNDILDGSEIEAGPPCLDSRADRGSTFPFNAWFPRDQGPPAPPPSPRRKLEGLPVLVVDDDATNRLLLEELLARWGMVPTAVDGGRAAIEALGRARDSGTPFALVLLDALMPGMDGFAVAEAIRRDKALAGTSVMMLSSADQEGDIGRCRGRGIDLYLRKPIAESQLLDAIVRAFGPVPRPGEPPGAPPPRPGLPAPGRRLRVLLVEDNPVNQRLAAAWLEGRGHTVVLAGNGRQALGLLDRAREHEPFDLVLMDVQMPVMDGFQATAAIRAREAVTGGHVPIIAITAHALKGDRERCLAAGMDDYLSKPIRPEPFLALVEGRPGADSRGPAAGPPPAHPIDAAVFDYPAALVRARNRPGLLAQVAALFLDDSPVQLAAIRKALAAGDAPALERAAHRLKGSAGTFAASRALEAAQALEDLARAGDLAAAPRAAAALEAEVHRLETALRTGIRKEIAYGS